MMELQHRNCLQNRYTQLNCHQFKIIFVRKEGMLMLVFHIYLSLITHQGAILKIPNSDLEA
jgi:hypothetical protein